jgi:hypothetical protein
MSMSSLLLYDPLVTGGGLRCSFDVDVDVGSFPKKDVIVEKCEDVHARRTINQGANFGG